MRLSTLLAGFLAAATPAAPMLAQTPDSAQASPTGCAVLNGIRISANWGDSSAAGSSPRSLITARTTIDTTFHFDVDHRRWTRSSLDAMIAAGASSRVSTAPWRACVGIVLGMQQPTLELHGVRGELRLKVDLTPLSRIPGSGLSDSSRPNQIRR